MCPNKPNPDMPEIPEPEIPEPEPPINSGCTNGNKCKSDQDCGDGKCTW